MISIDASVVELVDQAARAIGQPDIPALIARAEVRPHPRMTQVGQGPAGVHLGLVNLSVSPALAIRYAAELIVAAKQAMLANHGRVLAALTPEPVPELPEPCCDKHHDRSQHVEEMLGDLAVDTPCHPECQCRRCYAAAEAAELDRDFEEAGYRTSCALADAHSNDGDGDGND
jgi:hypothetical protein